MRRLNILLLAASQLCAVSSRSFSIHEDVLSYPQFEVVFAEELISERDANVLLEASNAESTYTADFSKSSLDNIREANNGDVVADDEQSPPFVYEVMNMTPHRYLCSIPVLQSPPPENKTANELAKAEEARELTRATNSGWELITPLGDSCLYFMSGWWSYSFCNNREIVQFHALPSIPNGKPPQRDTTTAEYVLGRRPATPASTAYQAKQDGDQNPPPAELQSKGDKRYLVQKIEDGDVCDLTERPRTIEVQYHCAPTLKTDRIGWIKEVTICAYLMVIHTPRLCNDIAFLPPQETKANPISCQRIVDDLSKQLLLEQGKAYTEEPELKGGQLELQDEKTENTEITGSETGEEPEGAEEEVVPAAEPEINVGGVIVGGRNVLSGADEEGKPPVKLEPPRSYFAHSDSDYERFVEVVAQGARKDGGFEVTILTDEELQELELDPKSVKDMVEKIKKLAKDTPWKLEMVELPGDDVRELRAYIDDESKTSKSPKSSKNDKTAGQSKGKSKEKPKNKAKDDKESAGNKEDVKKEAEGSEEQFFREDL